MMALQAAVGSISALEARLDEAQDAHAALGQMLACMAPPPPQLL